MPGKRITQQQGKLYMSQRSQGHTQITAAAKSGCSERSGRRIEKGECSPSQSIRHWRTRKDPFKVVWDAELVPLLEVTPALTPMTLLEYLQEHHPGVFPDSKLRTLQRRIKKWKALNGPDKALIFMQEHIPGRLGLSDFTHLKGASITIAGKPLKHLLYHFRLAFSGWSYMKVILGGESFIALSEGLQEALWRLGGSPLEHRTDSLSAAFKNLNPESCHDLTERYKSFCKQYNMLPTRNNRGISHENGSIEGPHGHLKRRIKQALLLRQSSDFKSVADYQIWLEQVVQKHNQRNAKQLLLEREALQALPRYKALDFEELIVPVHRTGTIEVKRITYSVPSRLSGERLRIHCYDDRLRCYLGSTFVMNLPRLYPIRSGTRAKCIDYRHLINSLVKKPQAFRFSQLRNEILPNQTYKKIWQHIEKEVRGKASCKLMVGILSLSAKQHCERRLGEYVLEKITQGGVPTLHELNKKFADQCKRRSSVDVTQHAIAGYDELITKRGKHYV